MAYRTVTVQLMNEDHTAVVQEWKLLRARAIRHVSGPFYARASDVAMEELTLAYDDLVWLAAPDKTAPDKTAPDKPQSEGRSSRPARARKKTEGA